MSLRLAFIITAILCSPSLVLAADVSTTLDNISGHWELEEESGTRAEASGSGDDLTDNNTVLFGTGIQGNAADFNLSSSTYLDTGNSTNHSFSGDWSVSFWVNFETYGASTYDLITRWGGGSTDLEYVIRFNGSAANTVTVVNRNAANTANGVATVSHNTISTGTWYHFVFIVDLSAGQLEVYQNGAGLGTSTGLQTTQKAGTSNLGVGCIQPDNSPANFVDGLIDELTLTSDIITASEVATLYNSGAGIPWQEAGAATTPVGQVILLWLYDIISRRLLV